MNEVVYFWSGWEPIFRILVVGGISYAGLVILLRLSGKRTLTRMTTFDFVVAIAIGSAFGRILTASIVSISEAITAFILLIVLQTIFSFLEVRSKKFKKFTTTPPTLLYYNGEYLRKNMRKERIREDELLGAIRKKGFGALNEVKAVIFETDGSFSVIRKSESDEDITYDALLEKEE